MAKKPTQRLSRRHWQIFAEAGRIRQTSCQIYLLKLEELDKIHAGAFG